MFDSIFRRKNDEKKCARRDVYPRVSHSPSVSCPALRPRTAFDPASWDFRAWGEVEAPLTLTWEEFNQLPRKKIHIDLHCVIAGANLTPNGKAFRSKH